MKSSKDMVTRWPNVLLLAEAGCGKTNWIGSLTKNHNPYIIDTEDGLTTIKDCKFDYETVNSFPEFEKECSWFMANYEKRGYTHLVVDSASRLQSYMIRDQQGDEPKLDRDGWSIVLAKFKKTIDVLTKKFPVPVVMTSTIAESKDEISGGIKLYPDIGGSFKHSMAGYFDCVFTLESGMNKDNKLKFWMRTVGDRRIIAKSRLKGMNAIEESSCDCIDRVLKK